MDNYQIFRDRTEAGQVLAKRLLRFKGEHPVVLALPRGGVTIGFEIARALEAPLDVVLVRKIGAPMQPELAVAAVVDGETPELVMNENIVALLGLPDEYLMAERDRQLQEIERRRALYLAGRTRPSITGKTAIVVDDGIATGATAKAALHAVRRAKPKRLVLAVPVAPPETIDEMAGIVDEIECLESPPDFGAIGMFYEDFSQVSDSDVTAMLAQASRFEKGKLPPGEAPRPGNGTTG